MTDPLRHVRFASGGVIPGVGTAYVDMDIVLRPGEHVITREDANVMAREFMEGFVRAERDGRITKIEIAQDPDPLTAPWSELLEES